MGINGLLPVVKNILKKKHISKYSGMRLGIDGHSWIHKIIPSIATDIYYDRPVDRHLEMLLGKIKSLTEYGINAIFVFDGDFLESKEKTVTQRRQLREKYKADVEMYLKKNDHFRAKEMMKRCVGVTPEIFHSVLRVLRANNIEFIVSPYEADAQLYFLQKINYIDYILTEDSDLIVYGATNILYKFDGSHVEEYDSSKLHLCKDAHFKENILDICILSGCDYLDSIKGVGLVTAHEKLKEVGNIKKFIDYMVCLKKNVPENYLDSFMKAKATFQHHIVYNPHTQKRQFLTDPQYNVDFLGSLENTPYMIQTKLGNEYHIERHFCPNIAAVNNQKEANDDFDSGEFLSPI